MKLDGTGTIALDRSIVWAALVDGRCLADCIPQCVHVLATAHNAWNVTVETKKGLPQSRFRGRWMLTEVEEPSCFIVAVDGGGVSVGSLRATVVVALYMRSDHVTEINYQLDIQFGGALAYLEQDKSVVQGWCRTFVRALAVRCEIDVSAANEVSERLPLKGGLRQTWARWLRRR